jgi:hypothetical protein
MPARVPPTFKFGSQHRGPPAVVVAEQGFPIGMRQVASPEAIEFGPIGPAGASFMKGQET